MSGINVETLKNAYIGLDEFRSMVNYVKGTNKGSVRALKGSNGKVYLEKINNKISFAPHFTNLSTRHNQALRSRMVSALQGDTVYMPAAARQRIIQAVTKCGNDAFDKNGYLRDNVVISGDRLKRTEIRTALDLYDEQFNTSKGRKGIVNRMCIDLVKNFIWISNDEEQDAKLAKKFIEESLNLKVDDLFDLRQLDVKGSLKPKGDVNDYAVGNNLFNDTIAVCGESEYTVPMADAATFRLVLSAAKKKIEEAVLEHKVFDDVYTTMARNLIDRGEILDYTYDSEIAPGTPVYDLFTDLFNNLAADKLGFGKLTEEKRALLNAHSSKVTGAPKIVQTYIRYVLGNRLADIMSKVDPGKLEHLKKLIKEEHGNKIPAIKKELKAILDIYHTIVNDALEFCREFQKYESDWIDEDITFKENGSDLKEKLDGKTGQVLAAVGMSRKVANTILAEINKSKDFTFSLAEKSELSQDIKAEKWANLYLALEKHFASLYNQKKFGIEKITDVKADLKDIWTERSQEIMQACIEQAKKGGVGNFAENIQNLVDDQLRKALVENKVDGKSPNFRTAYDLVYTYVMSGMFNDKELSKKLLSDEDGTSMAKATMLIANATGMVTRLLDEADADGQLELARLDIELSKLVKAGKLKEADANELRAKFITDCREQIADSLRTYLSGVRLNPDDSLLKIMSQGRKKQSYEWILNLFGLNKFEKDEMSPELKKMLDSAVYQAKLNARYAILQTRIGTSSGVRHEKEMPVYRKENLNIADWTNRALAEAKVNDSSLSDLFASKDKFRKTVVENWMNKVFKQYFCDAVEGNKKLFTADRHIDRTALEEAMRRFDKKALKTFKEFDAFQSSVLTNVKEQMADTLRKYIRDNNPAAGEKEIEDLVPRLVTDALTSGLETICAELEKTLVSGDGSLPRSGSDAFCDLVDRIALGILHKADTAFHERGAAVLKVIDDRDFKAKNIDAAVKTLLANPRCAELLKNLPPKEAERIVRSVISPLMPGILSDIRRFPAVLSLGGENTDKEKVAAFVQRRLTAGIQIDRITKFFGFREQFKAFIGTDEGKRLNRPEALLDDHFQLICDEVIYEDLPQVLDGATAKTVVGLLKNKVAERVGKVAESFESSLASFKTRLGQDGKLTGTDGETDVGSLGARVNALIDKALFGSEENGSYNVIYKWESRLPALGSLVDGSTFRLLAGTGPGANGGYLRRNLITTLAKIMMNDFIDVQKQVFFENEISGAEMREAELAGREAPQLKIKVYQTVDSMMSKMSDDELLARLNDILEGSLRKANEILSRTLSVDAMISDFAEQLEKTPTDSAGQNALTPEMKEVLLEDVQSAIKLNERNRQRLADADRQVAAIALRAEIANLEGSLARAPSDRSKLTKDSQLQIDDQETRLAAARRDLELVELGYLDEEKLNLRASDQNAKAMYILKTELARLEAEAPNDLAAITAKRQEIEDFKTGFADSQEILQRFDSAAGVVENGMLKRMKTFIDNCWNDNKGYNEYARIKAGAVNLAFDLWAGNVSESDREILAADEIMQYRKSIQNRMIDRLATDLRVEDFSQNVKLVMAYVKQQLTFKNVRPDLTEDLAQIITDRLTKIGDQAAGSIGVTLNDEFKNCLDGIKTIVDLQKKIDDLLWLASQQLLAEQFKSEAESPMMAQLASRMLAEYDQTGWMNDHGLKNFELKRIETDLQRQLAQNVKVFVRVALAETLGLKTERDAQAQTFGDSRQAFVLFLTDPVGFEKLLRERFRNRFDEQVRELLGKIEVMTATEEAWGKCMPDIIRGILPIHLSAATEAEWQDTTDPKLMEEIRRHHSWMSKILSGTISPGKEKSITTRDDTRDFEKHAPECRNLLSHDWALFIALQLHNDYGFDLFDGKHDEEIGLIERYVGKLKDLGDILLGNLFVHKQKYGDCCSTDDILEYIQAAIVSVIKAEPESITKNHEVLSPPPVITSLSGRHWFRKGSNPDDNEETKTVFCVGRTEIDEIRRGLTKLVAEINQKAAAIKPEPKPAPATYSMSEFLDKSEKLKKQGIQGKDK